MRNPSQLNAVGPRPWKVLLRIGALLGVVVVVLVAAGCTAMLPSTRYTFTVGGMERAYRVYVPKNVRGDAPLVVMLHAINAPTLDAEQSSGWDPEADKGKFMVAYPEGIGWEWNGNGCCGEAASSGVDDIAFISAMVERIPNVDRKRVYAAGLSNGGVMAYSLACNSDIFAAIGPVAATQFDPCPAPRPISVMHVHGLADDVIRFDGTPILDGLSLTEGPPVKEVNAFWRRVDNCAPPTERADGLLNVTAAECPDDRAVVLATVPGGKHGWPSYGAGLLWGFFSKHSK